MPQSDGLAASLFPVEYRVPPVLRATLRGQRVAIVNDVVSAGSAVRGTLGSAIVWGRAVAIAALAVLGASAADFAARNNLSLESLAFFPSRCGPRRSARCARPAWRWRTCLPESPDADTSP